MKETLTPNWNKKILTTINALVAIVVIYRCDNNKEQKQKEQKQEIDCKFYSVHYGTQGISGMMSMANAFLYQIKPFSIS